MTDVNGRKLSKEQSEKANALLDEVRSKLQILSSGDPQLLFYLRRRIFLRLTYDERGPPAHRDRLKQLKMSAQNGKCAICGKGLPKTESELDRFLAWKGYTPENTQLIHHDCHRSQQKQRGFGSEKPDLNQSRRRKKVLKKQTL
jgi:hypothetical protein